MTYINKLEELAKAATPGPWVVIDENEGDGFPPRPLWSVCDEAFANDEEGYAFSATIHYGSKTEADYIAAANPAALLALISQYRRMEEALKFYRCECAECGVDGCEWGAFGGRECGLIARQALQSTEQQG